MRIKRAGAYCLFVLLCMLSTKNMFASASDSSSQPSVVATSPLSVNADDNKKYSFHKNEGVPTSYYLQVGFALLLIVSIILAAAWLMRRLNFSTLQVTKHIKVESSFSLGPKEKLLIIRVENERILLGVTSQQINVIHKLASTPLNEEAVPVLNGRFSEKLQALLSGSQK